MNSSYQLIDQNSSYQQFIDQNSSYQQLIDQNSSYQLIDQNSSYQLIDQNSIIPTIYRPQLIIPINRPELIVSFIFLYTRYTQVESFKVFYKDFKRYTEFLILTDLGGVTNVQIGMNVSLYVPIQYL